MFAMSGDVFMGLSGGMKLFDFNVENLPYFLMSIGGLCGVTGHIALIFWGKGGHKKGVQALHPDQIKSIWLRPFFPWRYPLDSAFSFFIAANFFYVFAGLEMGNYPLSASGLCAACASALGWLWPQERMIGRFRSIQVTAFLFSLGTLNNFIASFIPWNIMIFLASCCYLSCNAILSTVRKEDQSTYTQTHKTAG